MISGLPPKSTPVRLNANDAPLIQRGLDSLYSPVDLLLAFLNGIFAGTPTAPTMAVSAISSKAGFKSILTGSYWSAATSAGVVNSFLGPGGTNTSVYAFAMPAAGSVLTIGGTCSSTAAATPLTLYVFKNGVQVFSGPAGTISGTVANFNVTVGAKGGVPFVAGDRINLAFSTTAAATGATVVANFTVELAA